MSTSEGVPLVREEFHPSVHRVKSFLSYSSHCMLALAARSVNRHACLHRSRGVPRAARGLAGLVKTLDETCQRKLTIRLLNCPRKSVNVGAFVLEKQCRQAARRPVVMPDVTPGSSSTPSASPCRG